MNAKSKKRPALGRGLSALVSSSSAAVDVQNVDLRSSESKAEAPQKKRPRITVISEEKKTTDSDISYIPVSSIEAYDKQPRKHFDEQALKELSQSIKELGVLQAILVRKTKDGGYQIIAGERRWRAAKLAGVSEIPVIIKDFDDKATLEVALVENIQRSNLSAIEEARAYKTLLEDFDISQEQLAQRLSKSRSNIANYIRLLQLPDDLLSHVNEGRLSMGHARALLTVKEPRVQRELAKKCLEEGMSVREVEAIVSRKVTLDEEKKAKKKVAGQALSHFPDIVDELRKILGTKVSIAHEKKKGSGKIQIDYFSESELHRIVELMRASG